MVMSDSSLFGHLALRFATKPENLATEALNFILQKSETARGQMIALASQAGITLPPDLHFRTQAAGADDAIPDLVGEDSSGAEPLIIETKFWAGLTERQPVDYIRRLQGLPQQQPGVLLVVAPTKRFYMLWYELLNRCRQAGLPIEQEEVLKSEFGTAIIDDRHRIALVSWRVLLTSLRVALEMSGERAVISDVEQLLGLCNRMDSEAFIPLSTDDLSSLHPRRILQYMRVVDAVVQVGLKDGWCSKGGLKQANAPAWYGHWIRLGASGARVEVDLRKWSQHCETPVWLTIAGKDWKDYSAEWRALSPLAQEIPPRALIDEIQKRPVVPLYLPTGVEFDRVVATVVQQLRSVYEMLGHAV